MFLPPIPYRGTLNLCGICFHLSALPRIYSAMLPNIWPVNSSAACREASPLKLNRNRLLVLATSCLMVMASACGGRSQMTATTSPSNTPGGGGSTSGGSGGGTGAGSGPTQATCAAVPVTMAHGPQSGVAPFPDPAPQNPSNPGPGPGGTVCVSTPANGATVTSPMHLVAPASLNNSIQHMRVFVDGQAEFFTFLNTVDTQMLLSPGAHNLIVIATDTSGNNVGTALQANVTAPAAPAVIFSDLQALPNWEACQATFPAGHPRAGQICAAGMGDDLTSHMVEDQSTPAPVSGSGATVAHFDISGSKGYENVLWTKYFASGSNVSHFVYDMYVMVDDPTRPQALEFDVNQNFGNNRWVFGTECNFKDHKTWDVWDGQSGWTATKVPCTPASFPASTWTHLVWQFERVGNQVHYVSLTVGAQTYSIDMYQSFEAGWVMQDIDVAFQMDIDSAADPYNVWLDKVTLTTY